MHKHGSSTADAADPREQIALLSYMVDHNRSHAEELHEVAHATTGEVADMIHGALDLFTQANDKLASALDMLKGE